MQDFGHGFFGGGFMWIFWILLIVLLVWVVKMVADSASGGRSDGGSKKQESAMEILDKRFARGEIDEEEYHRRRQELEK